MQAAEPESRVVFKEQNLLQTKKKLANFQSRVFYLVSCINKDRFKILMRRARYLGSTYHFGLDLTDAMRKNIAMKEGMQRAGLSADDLKKW